MSRVPNNRQPAIRPQRPTFAGARGMNRREKVDHIQSFQRVDPTTNAKNATIVPVPPMPTSTPAAGGGGSSTFTGNATQLRGFNLSGASPLDAQIWVWNATISDWEPVSVSGAFTISNAGVATLSTVGVGIGGTGANLSATGGSGQYVKQSATGAAFSVGAIPVGDLPANSNYRAPAFQFANGGSALTTGLVNACFAVPAGGTIVAVYLISPDATTGSATVDIIRANAAVPTSSNSIVGGGGTKPTLTTATYAKVTSFTGWTSTSLATDDIVSLNLTSVTSLKYLTVVVVIKLT